MSLTVCLLTRDAEENIQRALRSVAGLGAQVLVADTGSRDGTVQAARALGADVFVVPWHEDFGAAQNEALALAGGDWVFWLNPDEELLPEGREQLGELMARPDALAYVVRVQELTSPDQPPGSAVELLYPRLFRRRGDLRFVGRVQPHFDPPLDELARREGVQICRADLVVRRHAYASVLTPAKLRWATRLLKLELEDRPGQLHYLIELGHNLLRLNDPEGHAVMAEASEQVLAAWEAQARAAPAATVAPLLEYLLTVSPEQSKSRVSPQQASQMAQRWFPNSPPLVWVMAQRAFRAEDFRLAAGLLERLLHLGQTGMYDRSAPFDPSILAEAALVNLGACYLRLGELDRAEQCFAQVMLSKTAHQAKAQQGYAQVQARRKAAAKEPGKE